ncbi:sulfotransferase [Gilvimarinus japonicus]|uniref:Sulfotransferase n=1 Tax=Gilvimarinus japonicus TaxID=1796469 RepID=A0ABV7HU42_9GAMM
MTTPTGLKILQQELQQALSLIDDYSANQGNASSTQVDTGGLGNARSLLERCALVVNADKANSKPTLRILHHFACSGGTLISKCLAAQPNVFVLSELHPTTRLGMNINKAAYTPRDITTQAIYGRVPNVDALAEKLFVNDIIETEKHIKELGGHLVLRAHTHADYCTDKPTPQVDTLTRLLEPHFDIRQLVTVRHPIDSFMSLRDNGWIHFIPNSFDEYCARLLKFLTPFGIDKIIKYEDFVERPETQLKKITEALDLDMKADSLEYIDIFKISGDSGRSGAKIKLRPRKDMSEDYIKEISDSAHLKQITKILNYKAI